MINWDKHTHEDGIINLKSLFGATHLQGELKMREWGIIANYFQGIELIQPITSREVAAVAVSQARLLIQRYRTETTREVHNV